MAAIGASLLTGGFGFGAIWWQQRRADRAAQDTARASAYQEVIARSLAFTLRATTLRNVMQARSGLSEGVDVTMGIRRAADTLELHDWLSVDFAPLNNAWSAVQTAGSADAVAAAARVVEACGDLAGVATEPGQGRGKVASAVKGLTWTEAQQQAFVHAIERVFEEREAFIRVARHELGAEAMILPLEAAAHGAIARATDKTDTHDRSPQA